MEAGLTRGGDAAGATARGPVQAPTTSPVEECVGFAHARFPRSGVPTPGAKAQLSRRSRRPGGEVARMARRKKRRTLKPRLPARVRTKRRKGKAKNQQHPELIGLGLVALGVFLASILYLGWGGGMVGGWITDGFMAAIGAATYVAPVTFVAVGGLMVARSALVDVSPFRTGLAVTSFGLLAALGANHGGAIGRGLQGIFGILVGATGTTII